MPLKLSRRGLQALANVTDLDDEQTEILWIVKEHVDMPRGICTLGNVVRETGRGREAIRDVRTLIAQGYLDSFEY